MNKSLKELMTFVREQGVVGLAVGLAIGTEAGNAVQAIVANFINPIVGFILGSQDLSALDWTIITVGEGSSARELTIGYGAIISSLITLFAVIAVIFYVVKGLKLDKLDKKA